MPGPMLFTPHAIGGVTLPNRIIIAPMCQYSAVDGCLSDWHLIHLGQLALSGAGLLTIEATAVLPEGRISYADAGLWDDATEQAMVRTLGSVRRWSDMPVAIQLAHAGRKASTEVPWKGGRQIAPSATGGWKTIGPSAKPFLADQNPPLALDQAGMKRVRDAFAEAARRAARIGIDVIEVHAAHGYLLHQFLSPVSNLREDAYGGSLENRMRFPLEVFDAVRAAFDGPVMVRVSATDWVEGGWDLADTLVLASDLQQRGCAAIDVSSGGGDPAQRIPVGPGYQVPLARAIRQVVDMPVIAVGLITGFEQAEAIIATGDADFVALARGILYDPHWPWHAAARLGGKVKAPNQYLRSHPSQHRALFDIPQ